MPKHNWKDYYDEEIGDVIEHGADNYWSVIDVEVLDDFKLMLTFKYGIKRLFDASCLFEQRPFKRLKEKEVFAMAHVNCGTIEWLPDVDIAPEYLWDKSIALSKEEGIMQEVYAFIKECDTYYLATMDGDQPRVRPFGTIDLFEDKLYIQTGKVKDVSKQLHANGKCELCCFDGSTWLRVCGTLVEDDNVEARKHMLDAYPNLRAMYDENDGNSEVFYFDHAVATFSSFTDAPKVVEW